MRNAVGLLFLISLTLSGCVQTYNASMKLEQSPDDFKVLIGAIEPKGKTWAWTDINLKVTDGEISCSGSSTTEDWGFSGSMTKSKFRHTVPLECSDGEKGKLVLNLNWDGLNKGNQVTGQGIGKLTDGTKVKVILGNTTATLNW